MSLQLILARHAKSSWDDPALDDHDRPLNGRGRRSAAAVGAWLAERGWWPDLVLSSTARRTRETWAGMAEALDGVPEPRWLHALYHAEAEEMHEAVRHEADGAGTVLLIGHNPGIGALAESLARTPPAHPDFRRYPTAAVTIYRFDIPSWADLSWGGGEVLDFTVPRDLGVN